MSACNGSIMPQCQHEDRRQRLIDLVARLSIVRSLPELVNALRGSARHVAGCEGIAIVRREDDEVVYIAEDADTPMWTGVRCAIETCVSGLAILQNRPIIIPDIYADARVPHTAYRPTFVNSMAMFPIGSSEPLLALGAYWSDAGLIDPEAVLLLSSLARAASTSFDRVVRLKANGTGTAIHPTHWPTSH